LTVNANMTEHVAPGVFVPQSKEHIQWLLKVGVKYGQVRQSMRYRAAKYDSVQRTFWRTLCAYMFMWAIESALKQMFGTLPSVPWSIFSHVWWILGLLHVWANVNMCYDGDQLELCYKRCDAAEKAYKLAESWALNARSVTLNDVKAAFDALAESDALCATD
jgi:hypothetical protein